MGAEGVVLEPAATKREARRDRQLPELDRVGQSKSYAGAGAELGGLPRGQAECGAVHGLSLAASLPDQARVLDAREAVGVESDITGSGDGDLALEDVVAGPRADEVTSGFQTEGACAPER